MHSITENHMNIPRQYSKCAVSFYLTRLTKVVGGQYNKKAENYKPLIQGRPFQCVTSCTVPKSLRGRKLLKVAQSVIDKTKIRMQVSLLSSSFHYTTPPKHEYIDRDAIHHIKTDKGRDRAQSRSLAQCSLSYTASTQNNHHKRLDAARAEPAWKKSQEGPLPPSLLTVLALGTTYTVATGVICDLRHGVSQGLSFGESHLVHSAMVPMQFKQDVGKFMLLR